MKITWLGQAGLLFEKDGYKIIIDPYLSYSVDKINPLMVRRYAPDKRYFDIEPDMIILTHGHLDHTDPETLEKFCAPDRKPMTVLANPGAWDKVRAYGVPHNYVRFPRHTEWSEAGLRFKAVLAEHSDVGPIGVIIVDGEKSYYITGDTLYNSDILGDIKVKPTCVLLPINGVGNNMNMADAARFVEEIGAECAVPLHYGLYDDINADDFDCKVKKVIKPGETIEL